jgi:AmmeMemoRadiSam system protein B
MSQLRRPSAAGYFYPGDKDKLKEQLDRLLTIGQKDKIFENISGLVAPHAGYIYSGKTAAFAYNTVKGKNYKTVIIISPSHREYFEGVSVYEGDGYVTPMGIVEINKEMVNNLTAGSNNIFKGTEGHHQEHGVEVHLPFLQFILEDFNIVPIVMGDQSKIYIDELAKRISENITDSTLIIASSDMSHFYSRPVADELDSVAEQRINTFDYEGLYTDLEHKRCEACGGGPIVAMMKALDINHKNKSEVLDRSDSGEMTRNYEEVVGYLSAAVYQQ